MGQVVLVKVREGGKQLIVDEEGRKEGRKKLTQKEGWMEGLVGFKLEERERVCMWVEIQEGVLRLT